MRAILFDMDGTLLDSLQDLADCANATLRHFHRPEHPVEAYKQLVGGGVSVLISRAMGQANPAELSEASDLYRRLYSENWSHKTKPYSGIPELLALCRLQGIKTGILSNKVHAFTTRMAEHYFPGQFACVLGVEEGRAPKPDPAGALELAERMGLSAADCAYVGDSDVDMITATRAGMEAWGAGWGFRGVEELQKTGADHVWPTPAALTDYLRIRRPS